MADNYHVGCRAMKLLLCTLFLLRIIFPAVAQHKPEKILFESECPQYDYCKDCGDKKAFFPGKLRRHFEKELNFRDFDLIEGVVLIQVAVDSTGKPCANKFYNFTTNTSEEITRLALDRIISRMPEWQPAEQNGLPVNSFVLLAIYAKVEKLGVFHIDYLRNDKNKRWVVNTKNNPILLDYREVKD